MTTFDSHANFAISTITKAPSPATTGESFEVKSGSLFTHPFNAVVWPANTQPTSTNCEIVRVEAISGNAFTAKRHEENTTARAIQIGWQIADAWTVHDLESLQEAINERAELKATSLAFSAEKLGFNKKAAVTLIAENLATGSLGMPTKGEYGFATKAEAEAAFKFIEAFSKWAHEAGLTA